MLFLWFLLALGLANTETYLIQIPYYYDIPNASNVAWPPLFNTEVINSSTTLIADYPILSKTHPTLPNDRVTVRVPYDTVAKPKQKLLVRLNNYNSTFASNDLISIKVCWPATEAYSFSISHQYIESSTLPLATHNETLDLYAVIEYQADFVTFDPKYTSTSDELAFNLFLTVLPNRIPIPLELYDYITYLVGLLLVLVPQLPHILRIFGASKSTDPRAQSTVKSD